MNENVQEVSTFEKVKSWCEDHKTELIIAGVAVVAVIGGVILFKRIKKADEFGKAIEKSMEKARQEALAKHFEELPIADFSSITMRDEWLRDQLAKAGETNLVGKTVVQSLANVSYELMPATDFIKAIPTDKACMTEAIIDGFSKLLENVDPEAIKSITMLYDVAM